VYYQLQDKKKGTPNQLSSRAIRVLLVRTWSSTLDSANFSVDSRLSQGFIVSFASSGTVRFKPCTLPRKRCQSVDERETVQDGGSLVPVDYII